MKLRIRETRFANGLELLTLERRHHPVVTAMLFYRVGSRDEGAGETGLSHFLEHMMFKGTKRLAKGEIDRRTSVLGGQNNAFTDSDYTAYYFQFASDRWEEALRIEADRMRGCTLNEREFEAEKTVVLDELLESRDDPWDELHEAIESHAFLVHPYHHPVIGWEGDVRRLDVARMRAFYERHYRPDNAILVLVGDFETRRAISAVERTLGKVPRPARAREERTPSTEPEPAGERRIHVDRDAAVLRMVAAYPTVPTGHADDVPLEAIASLLSYGRSSILYERIVRRDRLASWVSVESDVRRDPGLFWCMLEGLEDADEPRVLDAWLRGVEGFAARRPSAALVEKAKRVLEASFLARFETTYGLADLIGLYAVQARDRHRAITRYLEEVRALTPRRLQEVARRYLRRERRVLVVSRPRARGRGRARSTSVAQPARARGRCAARAGRSAAKAVDFPIEERRLANGIPCLLSRNAAVPTLSLHAFVDAGPRFEPRGRAGVSALTAALLEEGAGRRDGLALARAIESVGGFLSCSGTGVSISVTGEHWRLALDLLADLVRRPRFDADALEQRRVMQRSDLLAEDDEPRTLALRGMRELVYGRRHPLARPELGLERDLQALGREDVVAFHAANYAPERMIVAAAGDLPDGHAFQEHADRVLGRWRHRGAPLVPWPRIPARRPRAPRLRYEDRAQVNLYVGHVGIPRRHADYDRLLVLDHVLGMGSGFTDRLSMRLRDRLGLAYTVYAGITPTAGSQPGMFLAYVGTKAEFVPLALEGIYREVERIRQRKPQRAELELAIDYLVGSHLMAFERNADRVAYMIRARRLGYPEDHLRTFADRVRAVRAEDVREAARRHLHPSDLLISLVGPVEELEIPATTA